MTAPDPSVAAALEPLRRMLGVDGYDVALADDAGELIVSISARPDACSDCLVPKNVMTTHVERSLRESSAAGIWSIRLVYPTDAGTPGDAPECS